MIGIDQPRVTGILINTTILIGVDLHISALDNDRGSSDSLSHSLTMSNKAS